MLMEMIKSILIKNIKNLRKERDWSQEDLAEKTGFSIGTIKNIERGETWVTPETIEAICNAFEVSCERMFSSDEGTTVLNMPVSKTLKRLMAIPDEVYEMAQGIDPQNKVWETVLDALEIAKEAQKIRGIKKTNGSNHS